MIDDMVWVLRLIVLDGISELLNGIHYLLVVSLEHFVSQVLTPLHLRFHLPQLFVLLASELFKFLVVYPLLQLLSLYKLVLKLLFEPIQLQLDLIYNFIFGLVL